MMNDNSSNTSEGSDSSTDYDRYYAHVRNRVLGYDKIDDDDSSSSESDDYHFHRKRKNRALAKTSKTSRIKIQKESHTKAATNDDDMDNNEDSHSDDDRKVCSSSTDTLQHNARTSNTTIHKRNKTNKGRRQLPTPNEKNGDDHTTNNISDLQNRRKNALLFQDDHTGSLYIHPSAWRFASKLINEEAQKTTESISLSLVENGELDESRKVQLRSSYHVQQIISKVRQRLSNVKIPARYVKIKDLNLTDLQLTNEQRRHEIEDYRTLVKQLEKQYEKLERDYTDAKAKRDDLQKQLKSLTKLIHNNDTATTTTSATTTNPIHPILLNRTAGATRNTSPKPSDLLNNNNVIQTLASAPKDTMINFLKDLPSPYD